MRTDGRRTPDGKDVEETVVCGQRYKRQWNKNSYTRQPGEDTDKNLTRSSLTTNVSGFFLDQPRDMIVIVILTKDSDRTAASCDVNPGGPNGSTWDGVAVDARVGPI